LPDDEQISCSVFGGPIALAAHRFAKIARAEKLIS
jgi:hypothetical protein